MSFAFAQPSNNVPNYPTKQPVKDSVKIAPFTDSLAIISINDCQSLIKLLETEPGYTKHDYDQVNKALIFLIQTAIKRRNNPTTTK